MRSMHATGVTVNQSEAYNYCLIYTGIQGEAQGIECHYLTLGIK